VSSPPPCPTRVLTSYARSQLSLTHSSLSFSPLSRSPWQTRAGAPSPPLLFLLRPSSARTSHAAAGRSWPLPAARPRDAVVLAVDKAAAAGNAGLSMLCCCAAAACCLAGQGQAWPRRPTAKPQHTPLWPPKSLSSRPSRPPAGHHALRPFCETRKDFTLEFKKREGSFC
jgi:hypothetical protein